MIKKHNLPSNFTDIARDMIAGITKEKHNEEHSTSVEFNKFAIFTIVNGDEESSLDVDMFDCMRRDSLFNCNLECIKMVSDSILKIMECSIILNDRVKYIIKVDEDQVKFAHYVHTIHRFYYNHPESAGMELLPGDLINKSAYKVKREMKLCTEDLDNFIDSDDNCLEKTLKSVDIKCVVGLMGRFKIGDG